MSRSGYPPVASVEAELSQNRQRERSGSVSSLRRPPEELVEQESQGDVHNPNQSNLSPEAEDFIHEILAVNTLAMQRCKTEDLNEAVTMLAEAFERLNSDAATSAISDQQLLDQLKATTLCNMGVAECHRGQPRQALSHFEGARQLEDQWNMASPSIALNSCAAYNALRLYDKATAAALETIDMLRTLALQRKRNKKLMKEKQVEEGAAVHSRSIGLIEERPPKRSAEEDAMLNAALQPKIADSENKALWGAAWHNLAVAQVNTAKATRDTSEHSNSLFLFHNAMRATQELLGIQHPMYKAVVDTYRTVRARLHMHGAFKPHHTMQTAPLPKVDPREQEMEELQVEAAEGRSRHATLETQKQDLTITFRGGVTNGQKMVERVDRRAYPDAKDEAYQQGGKKRPKRGKGSSALYSMPLSETLLRATEVYGNPHPLLYSSAATGQNGGWEGADGTYGGGGGGGGAEQSGWGNTYGGPSQQSRHQGKGRQQGKPTSAAAGSRRQPKVHRLPELVRQNDRNGPRGNSANERGQSNRGNSRGPRPHPPQGYSNNGGEGGPQRMGDSSRMNAGQQGGANRGRGGRGNNANSPMSGRQAGAGQGQHWEQSKLLLLAQPPATMSTAYQQVALPSNGAAPQPEPPTSAGSAQQPAEAMPPVPPKDPGQDAMTQVDDELVPTAHQSTTMDPPAAATPRPRDLFGAMWVAADTNYVRHGNRIFGRPGYYVSSVMNVEPTGELVGAAQHVEDLTPAPMMTYSSSSSSRASLSSSTSSAPGACRNALATTVNPTRTLI